MSIVRPVRTEADYEPALERLDALMALRNRNPDQQDELEMLALAIEAYERRATPIGAPDPIDAIRFRMDQAKLTAADVAPCFGGRNRVYEVLNRRRDLTLGMIRALHIHLGIPADILLGRPGASLPEASTQDWNRFPVREMIRRGWLAAGKSVSDKKEDLVRSFLTEAFGSDGATASFRRGGRENAMADPHALTAWCAQAMRMASGDRPLDATFDARRIDGSAFLREIARLSAEPDGPLKAVARMREAGIRFLVLRHLDRTYLDGAAMCSLDGAPLVALSLRYDRLDNFWFCLLHELAHVLLHLDDAEGEGSPIYVDDMSLGQPGDGNGEAQREREADAMAGDALLPPKLWQTFDTGQATALRIVALAREAEVHPSIVAGRVRHELGNYRRFAELVGKGLVRPFFPKDGIYKG